VREIDGIIYKQHPYALSWYAPYVRMLYWNKFGTPKTVLTKYGDERSAYWFWYYDEDIALELEDAMGEGLPMPARPDVVYYDKAMGK
jgi:microcin C transport system substrate-binding protein